MNKPNRIRSFLLVILRIIAYLSLIVPTLLMALALWVYYDCMEIRHNPHGTCGGVGYIYMMICPVMFVAIFLASILTFALWRTGKRDRVLVLLLLSIIPANVLANLLSVSLPFASILILPLYALVAFIAMLAQFILVASKKQPPAITP